MTAAPASASASASASETSSTSRVDRAWRVLDDVLDPEVPVVSVRDLGIARDVIEEGAGITVVLTPTYSGCPATEAIERSVVEALDSAGLGPVHVRMQRAPAWTTDWISAEGRRKLHAYGIVPPGERPSEAPLRFMRRSAPLALVCPRCGSAETERIAAFGATACKALHRCRACGEPFEHFKPI